MVYRNYRCTTFVITIFFLPTGLHLLHNDELKRAHYPKFIESEDDNQIQKVTDRKPDRKLDFRCQSNVTVTYSGMMR